MATCSSLFDHTHIKGCSSLIYKKQKLNFSERFRCPARLRPSQGHHISRSTGGCYVGITASLNLELKHVTSYASLEKNPFEDFEIVRNINTLRASESTFHFIQRLILADLDPATAKVAIGILGPFLSAFAFLFIIRIVMSWYPKLPVGKFPFVIAYAPTEPLLIPTRKVIPPLGGVDITPVVWFGLLSFLNEILLGPQGLLVLISQQVN
ncbi:hypothetical protein K2173_009270 [Erythroxylum novogranatense]|uniref:Protein COFACTOR ASSEMBLY OF COMPLEX C SUBUNIT B CCB3, chloroplastic n=1 Tax=Erythroxylum novogranatense TaxID=1862640 RepID=A0AAV8T055_9ROSI|nr:hypothetical protein K2173_009270 [Erythroxylum novogranatense]